MKKKEAAKSNTKPALRAAHDYVKAQIALMKKHGHGPKLSRDEFEELVAKVERATIS